MKNSKTVLVVAAHPDDEILGCGGTVARLVEEGKAVYSLILGEGVTSRYDGRDSQAAAELKKLHTSCQQAGKALGVRDVFLESLPDNSFDKMPLLDIVKRVESHLQRIKPQTIYTHHAGDLNVDHRLTFQAVLTATRPLAGQSVREIYSFETVSATEWAFERTGPTFKPNVFVNISNTLDRKIKALSCYKSEMRAFPHPRSLENIRALARHRGATVGCDAAEAFELVRSVK